MTFLKSNSAEDNDALILEAMRGNQEAASFVSTMNSILHFFDDVADKDKPLTNKDIEGACWKALVLLPRNKFYQANFLELNGIVSSAIQSWAVANSLEQTRTDDELHIAFIIRSGYIDILIHCATLIGGFEWGRHIAHKARNIWHNETFVGYKENLDKQFSDALELRKI